MSILQPRLGRVLLQLVLPAAAVVLPARDVDGGLAVGRALRRRVVDAALRARPAGEVVARPGFGSNDTAVVGDAKEFAARGGGVSNSDRALWVTDARCDGGEAYFGGGLLAPLAVDTVAPNDGRFEVAFSSPTPESNRAELTLCWAFDGEPFAPFDYESPKETPGPGTLLGIDAEFVSLAPAVKEPGPEGEEIVVQPVRLGLARVSVVRGDPDHPRRLVPVIDDYIRAVEPVHDYLTRFSGLVPGDLDPATSKRHIVKLKHAYLKLRYLIDAGCIFVGHGLKQDFKMINVVVPPAQIVDTVELFHFKRQRKLSLRFLASYLLGADIQKDTHDSIEDARTAVRLYEKYLEMREDGEGAFREKLLEIYRFGKQHGFTGEVRPDNVVPPPPPGAPPAPPPPPGPPPAPPPPPGPPPPSAVPQPRET